MLADLGCVDRGVSMGLQIIKQPDGLFAVRSSETDTIILWNCTRDEIVDWFAERAATEARTSVERLVGHVDSGNAREAYFQFTVPWDRALLDDERHGGEAWRDFNPDGTLKEETRG